MLERDKDTPPPHSPSHSEGIYICVYVYTHYLLIFSPRIKKNGGGGGSAISLCLVHFIEGILSFDVCTWKEGVLQDRRGVLHPPSPI